jgi:pimeloyl-ACP methyl ester carboxylesterase
MGGPYARIFAGSYPSDIVGIVLIESSHPEQFDRLPMADNFRPPPRLLIRAVPLLRKVGIMRHVMTGELRFPTLPADKQEALLAVSASSIATVVSEFGEITQTLHQAQEVRSFGDVPLLGLSIGDAPDASRIPGFDQAQADTEFAIWIELQRELADLSSRGRLQQIPDSTHYMQFSQPDAVVDAVRTVLEEIRLES